MTLKELHAAIDRYDLEARDDSREEGKDDGYDDGIAAGAKLAKGARVVELVAGSLHFHVALDRSNPEFQRPDILRLDFTGNRGVGEMALTKTAKPGVLDAVLFDKDSQKLVWLMNAMYHSELIDSLDLSTGGKTTRDRNR